MKNQYSTMKLDKTFFIWASLFIVGLAFGYGSEVPDDHVFDCLRDLTYEGRECYKKAHGFSNSHRGGPLGNALRQLVPTDYKAWPAKHTPQRALSCITALENFMKPLKVVVESEKRSKFFCNISGHTLKKTLKGLLHNLENRIKDIDNYVRQSLGINIDPATLLVKQVNMTAMTSLAAQHKGTRGISTRKAVQLRNFVLLDYLDQVISDIKDTPQSCFNTKVEISDSCPI